MKRRDFFRSALGVFAGPVAVLIDPQAAKAAPVQSGPPMISVIRYPDISYQDADGAETSAMSVAAELGKAIKPGSVILMPSTRDETGQYLWDIAFMGTENPPAKVQRVERDKNGDIIAITE